MAGRTDTESGLVPAISQVSLSSRPVPPSYNKGREPNLTKQKIFCLFLRRCKLRVQFVFEIIDNDRKAAIKREESQVTTCAFPSVSRLNEVKHDIDAESQALLEEGHKEILQSECYEDYGCPSYIDRKFVMGSPSAFIKG